MISTGHVGPWLTPDGTGIVRKSARSGRDQLYLYDVDGKLVRPLTETSWPVGTVLRITDDAVWFSGSSDPARPYDMHTHRVSLAGGVVERLTEEEGIHDVDFAPDGQFFVDPWSRQFDPSGIG